MKCKKDRTTLALDFLKGRECSWNTKFEQHRNKKAREDALQEIVQELNFPSLAAEDLKFGIKTIRTRYSAESARITIKK